MKKRIFSVSLSAIIFTTGILVMFKKELTAVLCTAMFVSSCMMGGSKKENIETAIVSYNSLIEIPAGIELDEYGFNRETAEVVESRVKRNESLYLILRDLDVSSATIHEINQKSKGLFQVSRIQPGQRYLTYSDKENNKAVRLVLHANALEYVIIDWENEVDIQLGQKEIQTELMEVSGTITSSLYETLIANGKSTAIGNRLSDVFAWQIDFFRLYPGDSFKAIYEQHYVDGEPYLLGQIVAAEFTNSGRTYQAYYFEGKERAGYYDEKGDGVQKALLKAPFKFSQRVSSNFSHSRFHPVLKTNVPHHGVDYAAPLGTPVLSVGDGEVIEAQYRGANGNIVKIRHNSTYTTAYLHLNGFAKGVRAGTRVKQGQVIGYVGKTGRVTGVHLDYRIYKNGTPVNPLKVDLPPSKSVEESEKERYLQMVEMWRAELEMVGEDVVTAAVASVVN